MLPVALSLPRQGLARLVDARHVAVQLCFVIEVVHARSVLLERAMVGFEVVIGGVNQVLQGLHVQTILDASLVYMNLHVIVQNCKIAANLAGIVSL